MEWISVKDRLPEVYAKVLCYFPNKRYGSQIAVSYFESNAIESGMCADAFKHGKPTHWMPLPEPPKEDH